MGLGQEDKASAPSKSHWRWMPVVKNGNKTAQRQMGSVGTAEPARVGSTALTSSKVRAAARVMHSNPKIQTSGSSQRASSDAPVPNRGSPWTQGWGILRGVVMAMQELLLPLWWAQRFQSFLGALQKSRSCCRDSSDGQAQPDRAWLSQPHKAWKGLPTAGTNLKKWK